MRLWALLADTIPLYPLYALLFAEVGLSDAEISALFVVWSVAAVVVEVPSGALADRFSRRGALAAGGVFQAAGYLLWITLPGFTVFAAGFVLWALGGALLSGSREALLHDGLAAVGRAERFAPVYGQLNALELVAQVPAALSATVLFAVGEFTLVGWVSVGMCLTAAAVATRIPEPARSARTRPSPGAGPREWPGTPAGGYLAVLRAGGTEAFADPAVRGPVLAVALLA
ncbi:MFS transporter, partial [Saccharomonospora iraqiensis]|uniref:MFS transporter n=1 Tax=Saccharomonospora iraqiensis TaxID=52698 RepID=UPI00022E1D0C